MIEEVTRLFERKKIGIMPTAEEKKQQQNRTTARVVQKKKSKEEISRSAKTTNLNFVFLANFFFFCFLRKFLIFGEVAVRFAESYTAHRERERESENFVCIREIGESERVS